MKTIGIIGGMSWHSTATYHRLINEEANRRLGGLHSARLLIRSLDFAEIVPLQRAGNWNRLGELLAEASVSLERGGADFFLIACNTVHQVFDQATAAVAIPALHIGDALGRKLQEDRVAKVGMIGTRHTMEGDFLCGRLRDRFGIEPVIPEESRRETLHRIVYNELALGIVKQTSREETYAAIEALGNEGAEAVVLGCTEFSLLVQPDEATLPLFDTTEIHALAAVDLALA